MRRLVAILLVTMLGGAWVALAQRSNPGAARPANSQGSIATVGTRSISRDEFQKRAGQALAEYRGRLGSEVPEDLKPAIRRQLLESLIRRELLSLEAQRRGMMASEAEADVELRRDPFFNPNGQFDLQRYEAVRTGQPEAYRRSIQELRVGLSAKALNDKLEEEYVNSDPTIRAGVQRDLTRASVDVLALRRSEFRGEFREPRESEVLAVYRAHPERFRRTAKAMLTILQVDQPPLPEGVPLDSRAGNDWKTRMKARAEAALAEAKAGTPFDSLLTRYGSVRHNVEVTPDNFPGYWHGDARDAAAVFATRPGGLLSAVVSGTPGWLVVRVERVETEGVARLAEVARQIRSDLRSEAQRHSEETLLRPLYTKLGDSLRTTGWRVRYAVFDRVRSNVTEPTPAELDRWYRSHQADFSSFDAEAGRIAVRPFADVRNEVRERWYTEQRSALAKVSADQVEAQWRRGQRDRNAERAAISVREVGPIVEGAVVDTGRAAAALTNQLALEEMSLRTGSVPWDQGEVVYQIYEQVPRYLPPFEMVRAKLTDRLRAESAEEDERGGRALYDKNPDAFARGNVIYYSRIVLNRPSQLNVKLTRSQVERYHRSHLDKYSAPEMVWIRHLLVAPSGTSDQAWIDARKRADELRARAVAGEDFAQLAREHSDDVATREKGGDLGSFARGTMIESVENVAFRMKQGEISDVIRTEVGWDILQCRSHDPIHAEPLRYVYANVGWDLATEQAESLVVQRVDSLQRVVKTPAQGRALATKLHLPLEPTRQLSGSRVGTPEMVSFSQRLDRTQPGQMVPGRGYAPNAGHFIAWVDSIVPARAPSWENARKDAIALYQRGAGQRALNAKRAELDSLMASGWSIDSVAALFGGFEHVKEAAAGLSLPGTGGSEVTDSLIFGTRRTAPVLKEHAVSDWLELPSAVAKVRLESRTAPNPGRLSAQLQTERRLQLERKLQVYFEDLKKRYPVKILDAGLRDTPLPTPPPPKD